MIASIVSRRRKSFAIRRISKGEFAGWCAVCEMRYGTVEAVRYVSRQHARALAIFNRFDQGALA